MTMHLFVVQSFVLYVCINVCMYGEIFHPIGHVFSVTFSVTLVGQDAPPSASGKRLGTSLYTSMIKVFD